MSENQYDHHILLLKKDYEKHPLFKLASRGFNAVNCSYLDKLLSKIEPTPRKPSTLPQIPAKVRKHPAFATLTRRKSELFLKRRKLSNSFHDVATNEKRRAISFKIEEVQEKIARTISELDYMVEHGVPPANKRNTLPTDPVLLLKKKLNLTSMLSRARAKLKKINKADTEAIRKQKATVKRYSDKLKKVKNALQRKGLQ